MNDEASFQPPAVLDRPATPPAPAADPFGPLLDREKYDLLARASKAFSESALVPAHFRGKPADIFLVLNMAYRLNLDPFTALQAIFVVSGRPGMSATLVISLANRSGIFAGPIMFRTEGEGDAMRVTASGTIRSTGETVSATVSMAMARAEGWTKNPKYQSIPDHMLTFRAATWLVRRYCPEVLMGMQTAEELQDVAAARPAPVQPMRPPSTLKAPPEANRVVDAEAPASPSPTLSESDHRRLEAMLKDRGLDRGEARRWFELHGARPAEDGVVHLNRVSASLSDQLVARLDVWADAEDLIASNHIDRQRVLQHLQEAAGKPVHLADLGPRGLERLVERVGQWRDDPDWRVAPAAEDAAAQDQARREALADEDAD